MVARTRTTDTTPPVADLSVITEAQEPRKTLREVWEEGRQVGLIQARGGWFYGSADANPYPVEEPND